MSTVTVLLLVNFVMATWIIWGVYMLHYRRELDAKAARMETERVIAEIRRGSYAERVV